MHNTILMCFFCLFIQSSFTGFVAFSPSVAASAASVLLPAAGLFENVKPHENSRHRPFSFSNKSSRRRTFPRETTRIKSYADQHLVLTHSNVDCGNNTLKCDDTRVLQPLPPPPLFTTSPGRKRRAKQAPHQHQPQVKDTYVIILSASKYWFNYRHTSNALAFYSLMKKQFNVPDDRILLFLADGHACSPANPYPGTVYNQDGNRDESSQSFLYPTSGDIEVDFTGPSEVTPDAFLRAITGRTPRHRGFISPWTSSFHPPPHHHHQPQSSSSSSAYHNKRTFLHPGRQSTLVVYMTGHGGDGFLKFHDKEELSYAEFASSLADAHAVGRFGKTLVIADTCQAATVGDGIGVISEHIEENEIEDELVQLDDFTLLQHQYPPTSTSSLLFSTNDEDDVLSSPVRHTPGTLVIASSVRDQNSYAIGGDGDIGVSLADGFTKHVHDILTKELLSHSPVTTTTTTTTTSNHQVLDNDIDRRTRSRGGSKRTTSASTATQRTASLRPMRSFTLGELCAVNNINNYSSTDDTQRDIACTWLLLDSQQRRQSKKKRPNEEAATTTSSSSSPKVSKNAITSLRGLLIPEWKLSSTVVMKDAGHVPSVMSYSMFARIDLERSSSRKQSEKEEEEGVVMRKIRMMNNKKTSSEEEEEEKQENPLDQETISSYFAYHSTIRVPKDV